MEAMASDYKYPDEEEHNKMVEKVHELKEVIERMHPSLDLHDKYKLLDH